MTIEVEVFKNHIIEFPDGTPPQEIERAIVEYQKSVGSIQTPRSIDTETGAPLSLRAAMGTGSIQDQMATIRNRYPDVQFEGPSVMTGNTGDNFIYTNPETGRKTLANPPGFDVGDVVQHGGEVAETVGGMAGGAVGSLSANPAGTYAGMGLGAGMARELYDLFQGWINGRVDTRDLTNRINDAAGTVTVNAAVPKVFDSGVSALKTAGRSMVSPVKNRLAGAGSAEIFDDFANAGIRPSAGAVSGNRTVQQAEKGLSGLPGSARIMQDAASETIDGTATAVKNLADEFGPTMTVEGAGESIKGAARNAATRFKLRSELLYNKLGQFFTPDEKVPISNTMKTLQNEVDVFSSAPKLSERFNKGINDILQRVISDAPDGQINFKVLQRLRSDVGAQLGDAVNAVDDLNRAQLKRLYSALVKDVEGAAMSKGQNAQKIYKTANRYYSINQNLNIPVLDRILKTGTDEAAFNYAMQSAKDGGSKLRALRRNFKPEEWDIVAGTTLGRMGRAAPGAQSAQGDVFQANRFLTNWNKLSPEAQKAIFGGTRYKELRPQLNRLLRIMGSLKDVESMANPSGTAQSLNFAALMSSLGGGLGGAAIGGPSTGLATFTAGVGSSILAPRYTAKLITNPKFVKWLSNGAAISKSTPGNLPSHIARLYTVAEKEPEIRREIHQYLEQLKNNLPQGGRNAE